MVGKLPPDVGVICVCPSHQFPLGVAMSARRRQELIDFAHRHGAVIIEDDYDGEFRFDGSPLRALRTSEAADVVFYVGTFSKCMLSSLRLGFVVVPDWAMQTLIAAKNCLDWHCPTPIQLGVAAFIAEGHLARHVRKMRGIYKHRRQTVLKLLDAKVGEWLTPLPSFYGMHIAAEVRGDVDPDVVEATLLQRNVKMHSLGRYYLGPQALRGLVLGYGAVGLAEIARGVRELRAVFLEG
jgi:GntR family transcriptional regulator / MocR family aminotransferase